MKTNEGMTKVSIAFNGRDVWNLGDKLERDQAERTTAETTQKYCLIIYKKILMRVGSSVCKTAHIHSSEITAGWGSVRSNVMFVDCAYSRARLFQEFVISKTCYIAMSKNSRKLSFT